MKRTFLFALLVVVASNQLLSQEEQRPLITLNTLNLATRADFTYDYYFKDRSTDHGFEGKFLNVALDGRISDKFSYHLRQRINSPNAGFSKTFFQGTDWAYLNWYLTDNLFISAGKQVIAIGGWEYDTPPIDIYYGTYFWNNVACYEIGGAVNYKDNSGKNWLLFQVTNSPFITKAREGIYAYNLMWYGNFNLLKTSYSVNMLEYKPGHFINYISLGNKIHFKGVEMYLDIQNRGSFEHGKFFGHDMTAIYGIGVDLGRRWVVFAKAGYDFNKAQPQATVNPFDLWIVPGSEVGFESIGFEFFPLVERKLRLHVCGSHANVNGQNKFQANIGLTWKVDLHRSVLKN